MIQKIEVDLYKKVVSVEDSALAGGRRPLYVLGRF